MGLRQALGAIATIGALIFAGAASAQPAACNEKCLLLIASQYMDAMSANDPAGSPVGQGARTMENGIATPLTAGIWKTATGWGYRHTFVDTARGEIGAFGAVTEAENGSAMLSLRLKVVNRKVTESEILVARKGDFSLYEPFWSAEPKPIFKEIVPVERRSTRAQLAAIPQHYFDAISQGKPSLIDVHPDAVRVENGYQTTGNPKRPGPQSISEGLNRLVYMQKARQVRAPIIDESRGLVLGITAFDLPLMTKTITVRGKPVEITPEKHNLPRTLLLYELFKVEGGMVVAIEAVMRNAPLGADLGWPAP